MTERYEAPEEAQEGDPPEEDTTGRYVITLEPTEAQEGIDVLRQIGIVPNTIFEGAGEDVDAAQLNDPEATIYFKSSGIIILGRGVSPEQLEQIRAAVEADTPIESVALEYRYEPLSFP
jgi:hypothetical protein